MANYDAEQAAKAKQKAAQRHKSQARQSSSRQQPSAPHAVKQQSQPQREADPQSGSRQQLKREFLQTVDESISGSRIQGNPYKFVGKRVDLHCIVEDIPQEDFLNAACPPDEYGIGPVIVIETDTKSLEKGQQIRVLGTVVDPMDGTNAMGGQMHFPTVKAEFME